MRLRTRLFTETTCASKRMLAVSCCTLAVLATTARGAPPEEPSLLTMSLEELTRISVKSASFFEQDALSVGSSVSVIEREDWERKGARRTLDAIAQEPSVMLYTGYLGLNVIAIRGYGQAGSSRGIATLVDGIPMNGPFLGSGQYNVQNVNLGVLDRIELIRGPGSALYGTDAFHGVVSMSTFESEEDLTRVSAEGGFDHYYQASLQHSVGLGDKARLDFALGVSGEERDRTYQARDLNTLSKAEFNPDESYRSRTGSLKLTLNPTPRLQVKGSLFVDSYDAYNYPGSFYTVSDSELNTEMLAGQLSATHSFEQGRTLEARIFHVRKSDPRSLIRNFGTLGLVRQYSTLKEERTGTTLTFRQPETERWRTEYAASLGVERAEVIEGKRINTSLNPPAPPVESEIGGSGKHRDIAHLVLDAQTALSDRWSVVYGGRVDHYNDVATQTSPRLGVVFQPVEDTAIKLLYQHAFRAPTFAEQYYPVATTFSPPDPETLDSFELVFLKQSDDWKTEIVLFQSDWGDAILVRLDPSLAAGYIYENSGESQSRGIEASLSWNPDPWRVDLSGSYVRSRNLEAEEDYDLFPPIMINVGVGRTFGSHGISFYLNNLYSDGAQDVGYNRTLLGDPEDLPAYWRTDLNVTKRFASGLDLFANVINLFDRDNRVPSILGLSGGVADRPLSVSAGLRCQF